MQKEHWRIKRRKINMLSARKIKAQKQASYSDLYCKVIQLEFGSCSMFWLHAVTFPLCAVRCCHANSAFMTCLHINIRCMLSCFLCWQLAGLEEEAEHIAEHISDVKWTKYFFKSQLLDTEKKHGYSLASNASLKRQASLLETRKQVWWLQASLCLWGIQIHPLQSVWPAWETLKCWELTDHKQANVIVGHALAHVCVLDLPARWPQLCCTAMLHSYAAQLCFVACKIALSVESVLWLIDITNNQFTLMLHSLTHALSVLWSRCSSFDDGSLWLLIKLAPSISCYTCIRFCCQICPLSLHISWRQSWSCSRSWVGCPKQDWPWRLERITGHGHVLPLLWWAANIPMMCEHEVDDVSRPRNAAACAAPCLVGSHSFLPVSVCRPFCSPAMHCHLLHFILFNSQATVSTCDFLGIPAQWWLSAQLVLCWMTTGAISVSSIHVFRYVCFYSFWTEWQK